MESNTEDSLSQRLENWRRQLRESEGVGAEDVEELEGHLRDSMAGLQSKGLSEEEAFLISTRRLGEGSTLGQEYTKAHSGRVWARRGFWMVLGVVGLGICSSPATVVGWLTVATANLWVTHATVLGVLGLIARVMTLTLLLAGSGFLLWSSDQGKVNWLRRHPWRVGIGLGLLGVFGRVAATMSPALWVRSTPMEVVGRTMQTTSYGGMALALLTALTLGIAVGLLAWLAQRRQAVDP